LSVRDFRARETSFRSGGRLDPLAGPLILSGSTLSRTSEKLSLTRETLCLTGEKLNPA
jgi:hypothetical protein